MEIMMMNKNMSHRKDVFVLKTIFLNMKVYAYWDLVVVIAIKTEKINIPKSKWNGE